MIWRSATEIHAAQVPDLRACLSRTLVVVPHQYITFLAARVAHGIRLQASAATHSPDSLLSFVSRQRTPACCTACVRCMQHTVLVSTPPVAFTVLLRNSERRRRSPTWAAPCRTTSQRCSSSRRAARLSFRLSLLPEQRLFNSGMRDEARGHTPTFHRIAALSAVSLTLFR